MWTRGCQCAPLSTLLLPAAPDHTREQKGRAMVSLRSENSLKLISDLILWQTLMRMVCNVLRVDNGETRANTTFQTFHKDHVALLCRQLYASICIRLRPTTRL